LGVPKLQSNDKSKEVKINDLIDNGIGAPIATERLGDILHVSMGFPCASLIKIMVLRKLLLLLLFVRWD
jgi:hypothetical protein